MKSVRAIIGIFLLGLFGATSAAGQNFDLTPGLSTSFGLEYQLISQRYYNIVIDTGAVADDYLEFWRVTREDISDFLVSTVIGYTTLTEKHRLGILTDMEISTDRFLGRAEGNYRIGDASRNVWFHGRFESKAPFDEQDKNVDRYTDFEGVLRSNYRLSSILGLKARFGIETVNFDENRFGTDSTDSLIDFSTTYYGNDFVISSAQAGAVWSLDDWGRTIEWDVTFRHRTVADSATANYDDVRAAARYNGFSGSGYVTAAVEYQDKNYAQPFGEDDYQALRSDFRLRRFFDTFELKSDLQWELFKFRTPDIVNRDFRLYDTRLAVTRRFGEFAVGPVGRIAYRDEDNLDLGAEEYLEAAGGAEMNLLGAGSAFFSGELLFGKRDYRARDPLVSSYRFVSIAVIGTYRVGRWIDFTLLFDGDFESHDVAEDDSNLILVSAGLSVKL